VKNWLEPGHQTAYVEIHPLQIKAIEQQTSIGWHQFVWGRIVITWGEIINNHLEANEIQSITAEEWGTKLIQINWQYIPQLWAAHNEAVHGSTNEDQNKKKKYDMMEELRYIQSKHGDIPSNINWFINATETQMERMHNNHMVSYIAGKRILANTIEIKEQRVRDIKK
jgi:hypothetical protein